MKKACGWFHSSQSRQGFLVARRGVVVAACTTAATWRGQETPSLAVHGDGHAHYSDNRHALMTMQGIESDNHQSMVTRTSLNLTEYAFGPVQMAIGDDKGHPPSVEQDKPILID